MDVDKLDKYLRIDEKRFPSKAVNFNKIPDADGFWDWDYKDAMRTTGLSNLNPKKISDIIFWLNMASDGWELKNKPLKKVGI